MTDFGALQGQIEAVLATISQRIIHTPACVRYDAKRDVQGKRAECVCDRSGRVRTEIARCVVESWKSSVLGYRLPPDATSHVVPLHAHRLEALKRGRALSLDDPIVWAAAFRATQEQETQK